MGGYEKERVLRERNKRGNWENEREKWKFERCGWRKGKNIRRRKRECHRERYGFVKALIGFLTGS